MPLQDALSAAGARFGEYGGAETAADFGDVRAEFMALESGCGVFDLGWRAKIILAGEDRIRWLNGMVTNNVKDLAPGHGVYTFVLNAQGHILGDLYVYNRGDHVLADTDRAQAARLTEIFNQYIIMDDVELSDGDAALTAIGVAGPNTHDVLSKAGLSPVGLGPLQMRLERWRDIGLSLVRKDDPGRDSFEIWAAPAQAAVVWQALVAAGAKPAGSAALELTRIAAGVPRYGIDIRERDLPQETEQHRALNFTKGCYVGQEIVERIRSRGAVHRKFTGFLIESGEAQPGAKLSAAGKEVGQLTSVAAVPGRSVLALGYIRREAATPGTPVEIADARAKVAELPFSAARGPQRSR